MYSIRVAAKYQPISAVFCPGRMWVVDFYTEEKGRCLKNNDHCHLTASRAWGDLPIILCMRNEDYLFSWATSGRRNRQNPLPNVEIKRDLACAHRPHHIPYPTLFRGERRDVHRSLFRVKTWVRDSNLNPHRGWDRSFDASKGTRNPLPVRKLFTFKPSFG